MSKYYEWKKGDKIQFTPHFNSSEFECQCKHADCIDQRINVELVERLEKCRQEYGKSVKINSGYRCKKHNKEVGGVDSSQHLPGDATDSIPSAHTTDSLDLWVDICKKHFDAIGIASNFVHTDMREPHGNGEKRIWYYAS